jgi:hypothetical protein
VRVPKVPTQHFAPPTAFKAHDIVGANRLADRDSRAAFWLWFGSFPDCKQRLIHRVDERRYVSERDLVLLDVAADDLSNQ